MSLRTFYGAFFIPTLLLILVLGPPLWLDHAPEADAVVTRKYEGYRLNRDADGGWRRRLSVWTRFRTPAGVEHTSEMMLGDADYDNLTVGSPLRVRYLPIYPYTTRPVARTTIVQARELFTPETTRGWWMTLLLVFAPLTFLATRLTKVAGIAVAAVWLWASWAYILRPKPLPMPGPQHASANVSWTQVVSRGMSRGRRDRLRVPYRLVALTFMPPGARDSITVLDAVDSASLTPKPAHGTLEPIGYEPGTPRTARLLVGTRTFINANRYEYIVIALSPIVLVFLAGTVRWKRRAAHGAPLGGTQRMFRVPRVSGR
jgi:hypothetical protein